MSSANATISAFGLNIAVSGSAEIYAFAGGAGFVYYNQGSANFDYDNGLFQLQGSYIVDINSNAGLYEISIPNASASVLGLSVSGSAKITDAAGDLDLNASLDLVIPGVTEFSLVGDLNSDGAFSLTAGAGFTVGANPFSFGVGGSVTIDNSGFAASVYSYADIAGDLVYGSASLTLSGSDFHVSANVDNTNFFNIYIGSSATTPVSPEIYNVVVPATATEESPVALSAQIFDSQFYTYDSSVTIAKWTISRNGGVYQTVTDAIENGEGTATDSFTPDDGGTYTVSLYAYKFIYFSDGSSELVTPVLTTATIVVPGIAPTIDSESVPHFAPAGQPITLSAGAHDESTVEEAAGLSYSWNITKDGKLFIGGTGASFSFTPDGPGVFGSTLTVTDAAGRSTAETNSILVGSSALVVNQRPQHRGTVTRAPHARGGCGVRQCHARSLHHHLCPVTRRPDHHRARWTFDRWQRHHRRHGRSRIGP